MTNKKKVIGFGIVGLLAGAYLVRKILNKEVAVDEVEASVEEMLNVDNATQE